MSPSFSPRSRQRWMLSLLQWHRLCPQIIRPILQFYTTPKNCDNGAFSYSEALHHSITAWERMGVWQLWKQVSMLICSFSDLYSSSFSTWSFHCKKAGQVQLRVEMQQENENVCVLTYDVDFFTPFSAALTICCIIITSASSWKVMRSSLRKTTWITTGTESVEVITRLCSLGSSCAFWIKFWHIRSMTCILFSVTARTTFWGGNGVCKCSLCLRLASPPARAATFHF